MKRSPSPTPTISDHPSDIDFNADTAEHTPPPPPSRSPKKAKATLGKPSTPKSTPTKKAAGRTGAGPTSEKGKLVALLITRGIKGLDKKEAEELTGLKATQIKQLLRADGKGGVYNALMRVAEDMQ